ncbi:MAG: hypothetical protein ABEK03_04400 [Candidatus Bipolaricaulia bacterium]
MSITRRNLLRGTGLAALGGVAAAGGSALFNGHRALAQSPESFDKVREPDTEIAMGEFYFQEITSDGRREKNAPIELPAGEELLIRVINEGNVIHLISMGRDADASGLGGYRENLFGGGAIGSGFVSVNVTPGNEFLLHIFLPDDATGEWEIGCFVSGHYQAGMKAPLIIN